MRFLYNLLTYLLLLPYAVYWLFRASINKSYRRKLGQRFGFNVPRLDRCIWIHAVSVGEVVAAAPLIRALSRRYPQLTLLVTTVTPTGAARVEALFGDGVTHSYIPFEAPFSVNNFFSSVNPLISLIMETEIWPNLYHGCGVRDIPLVLVSARISPKSVIGYRKLLPLFRETLSHGIVIAAQSSADADRFLSLGASPKRTQIIGNIKFDLEIRDDLVARGIALRRDLFPNRPVWIAASTHDGEEKIVLDTHDELMSDFPDLLLILVPRHPERFQIVRELLEKRETKFTARTDERACEPDIRVFLGDTMGEVMLFCAASDIAFVGGSLVPIGGHNLLEPAAVSLPIITGPHVFNAQDIADRFVAEQACRMVADPHELESTIRELLQNPVVAQTLGKNGRQILEKNRGALTRLMGLIEPLVDMAVD
ncbi:MAG: lipid IV(A) 3-deoxy-D-manno-octulosonic acid transferase [Gammaproteobacteria bacterium]|nr:lipid IV(A) 3-deoxy-D-manno-octulosonic acid transferase [Gammaproteobacteria bacterium]